VNVDDRDVGRFLRLYTLLEREKIEALERLEGADIREAKRELARAVTALVHGPAEAQKAEKAAVALFADGGDDSTVPSSDLDPARLAGDGLPVIDALAETGLSKSKGEARRLVRQGGVKVNGEAVKDEARTLGGADVEDGRIRLQVGKKKHHHLLVG
jgi:tyrosyl-tRNA synthetase